MAVAMFWVEMWRRKWREKVVSRDAKQKGKR